MSKVLYLDSETGGVKPAVNPLLTLACIMEIDGEVKDERLFKSCGFPNQIIEDDALRINGLTRDEIAKFPTPREMHTELTGWLGQHVDKFDKSDKLFIGGYKVEFDMKFVKALFEGVGDVYLGSWINGRKINPLPVLEWLYWRGDLKLPNLKLATVCAHFEIPLETAHDAMSDCKAAMKLIKKVDAIIFDAALRGPINVNNEPELSWLNNKKYFG